MKLEEIVKVIAKELGSTETLELNKLLKTKDVQKIKFKIMGKKLGYLGYNVAVKSITPDGLKIFDVKKVILIKFADIESFEKAKPKVARPVYPKKKPPPKKSKEIIEQIENKVDEDATEKEEEFQRPRSRSSFIPTKKSTK